MDTRAALHKNDKLYFPGMECAIEQSVGRGSNVIAYVGRYSDYQNPSLSHRVLIRELFPYDPDGGIFRDSDGSVHIEKEAGPLYDINRRTFERGNEVHVRLLEKFPAEIDLNINTYAYNNTLYSLVGYTGGRNLYEELGQARWKDRRVPGAESLLHIVRILTGALDVLQAFHKSGYLHLDISPDNILLVGEGEKERVTLIDYNSVHTFAEVRENRSVYYSTKEGFTAPEVRMGRHAQIREWTDLYSLSAVLYLCLTGKKLSAAQMVGTVPVGIGPEDSHFLKDCPETVLSQLRKIIRKGLAVTPRKRYQEAAQMRADLAELEDRILGRGITRWALWEAGRSRVLRTLNQNTALAFLSDPRKIYPLYAEKEDGERISLSDPGWMFGKNGAGRGTAGASPQGSKDAAMAAPQGSERAAMASQQAGIPDRPHRRPLILLGGGGMGKTTALLRIANEQNPRYTERSTAVYYISLYGYRGGERNFICDRLLESLKFKPHTDSMESARRELLQLLDRHAVNQSPGMLPPKDSAAAPEFRPADVPVLLLLLDGLNEAAGDTGPLLEEIHRLSALAGVRIVLTSRSDPGDPAFQKLALCRLEQTEVRRILSEEGILPPENMEVLDLLSFPMLLSMYIRAVKSGEKQLRVENREELLEDYFAAILEKEKRDLPDDQAAFMGTAAAVEYLLPEIAARTRIGGRSLKSRELFDLVKNCYRELSGTAITAVRPEWTGHSAALRCGAKNPDEWYGKAVLEILWKRLGLLVRDEQGGFRILHQLLEDYLAEKSRQFHQKFDDVKRKQRRWWILAVSAMAFLFFAGFGIYNYIMLAKITRQQQETLRNESLALASSSAAKLRAGNRAGALEDAYQALVSNGSQNRPFVEEAEYALTKALHVYETGRYHPSQVLKWSSEMLCCAVSPDGAFFVMLDEYGNLTCYDAVRGEILWSQYTSAKRNSTVSSQDLNSEKGGFTRNPEQRLPFLEILADKNAVFCIGEREPGMLVSLSDGTVLWRISDQLSDSQSAGGKADEQTEYYVETADLSEDRQSAVLGIRAVKTEKTASGFKKSDTSRTLSVFDLGTGKCTASSPSIEPSGTDVCFFTGKGAFSNEGNYYVVQRNQEKKRDRILCLNSQTGEVSDGPVIKLPFSDDSRGVTELVCRDRVYYGYGEHEGEIYQEKGIFYYSNEYEWDMNAGYSGRALAAFSENYTKEWTWSKEIALPGDAHRFPSMIPYDKCLLLLSGSTAVRLDPQGNEKRVTFEKKAVCIGQKAEGEFGSLVLMINEDGTVDGFNLYTMQKYNNDFESFTLLEKPLSGAVLSGPIPQSLCLFPDADHHAAVICTYLEDNRITGLENPVKEYPYTINGEFESIPGEKGLLYLKKTSLGKNEEGHYMASVYGSIFDADGTLRDRFEFETENDYLTVYTMQVNSDGSRLYSTRGPLQYDLKDHKLTEINTLPEDTTPMEYSGILSADTEKGILSAFWKDRQLTLWINGSPLRTVAPEEFDYTSPLVMDQTTLKSFSYMIVGENGLIVLCGSRRTKRIDTVRGYGYPVDYYLIYSTEKDQWTALDNASDKPGFPAVITAKNHPWFAAMDETNRILIYDAETGTVQRTIYTTIDSRAVADLQFILDDQYLVVLTASGSTKYEVIRTADGETVYTYQPAEMDLTNAKIVIQEDPLHSRIFITSIDSGRTGVCVGTDNWVTKFEIPSLCCPLGDDAYVVCRSKQELIKYPFFTLEELIAMAEEQLIEYGRLEQ